MSTLSFLRTVFYPRHNTPFRPVYFKSLIQKLQNSVQCSFEFEAKKLKVYKNSK